jgi:hypothetical protein
MYDKGVKNIRQMCDKSKDNQHPPTCMHIEQWCALSGLMHLQISQYLMAPVVVRSSTLTLALTD